MLISNYTARHRAINIHLNGSVKFDVRPALPFAPKAQLTKLNHKAHCAGLSSKLLPIYHRRIQWQKQFNWVAR